MKVIITIDPGASGGICVFNPAKNKPEVFGMPDDSELRDYIEGLKMSCKDDVVCYLEQVGGYIGTPQPGSAMFKFGDGFGYIRGLIDAARIKRVMVRPQVWQKGIPGIVPKMKGAERKRALRAYAARLFPNEKVTLKTADALAMLDYAKRCEAGHEAPIVDNVADKDFKSDSKAAVKWCKAGGHAVPKKNSKEFLDMVNYWVKWVKNNPQ